MERGLSPKGPPRIQTFRQDVFEDSFFFFFFLLRLPCVLSLTHACNLVFTAHFERGNSIYFFLLFFWDWQSQECVLVSVEVSWLSLRWPLFMCCNDGGVPASHQMHARTYTHTRTHSLTHTGFSIRPPFDLFPLSLCFLSGGCTAPGTTSTCISLCPTCCEPQAFLWKTWCSTLARPWRTWRGSPWKISSLSRKHHQPTKHSL